MLKIEQIYAAINKHCKQVDTNSMPVDLAFRDFGLDSLDMFNIFTEIEEVTGRVIPDEDIERLKTITEMLEYFNG